MLLRDALLAYIHFALILTLAALLFSEVLLYAQRMDAARLRLLQRIDISYGIVAGLIVASGLSRIFFGPKGAAFYVHNPVFWAKMGVFVAVVLLSIPPTTHYIALGRQTQEDAISVESSRFRRMRGILRAECMLLLILPLLAALMARGL